MRPYLKCVALYFVSVLRVTVENKTTAATIYFKKLTAETTCLLSRLLSKKSCLTVFTSMFNVSRVRLAARRRIQDCNAILTNGNGAIIQTLRQFAPLSDDRLLQMVDCRESETLISHLLKNIPNSTLCSEKKHPLTCSVISLWEMIRFAQNFHRMFTRK